MTFHEFPSPFTRVTQIFLGQGGIDEYDLSRQDDDTPTQFHATLL